MVQRADRRQSVWSSHGLIASRRAHLGADSLASGQAPRERRFRQALEERGGLFPFFGQFLAGRADLLSSFYLEELRQLKIDNQPYGAQALERDLGDRISGYHLIRTGACSEVYGANHENRPVVIESYHPEASAYNESSWDEFQREIRVLANGPEAAAVRAPVIEGFGRWLRLQADVDRKRRLLDNLRASPGGIVTRFPALIRSLESPYYLAYEAGEGRPIHDDFRIRPNPARASLQVLAEGLLEQALLLSVVDADVRTENYLSSTGSIAFRCVPAFWSVPVEWHGEFLQYIVCAIGGETPRAVHHLARMSGHQNAEQILLKHLSSLRPELKVGVSSRRSGSVFETYWQAHAASDLELPAFVQSFHRQMTVLAQWQGEIAPSTDLIVQSLWAVLGRLLRFRIDQNLTLDKAREWVFGSGLLAMASARQIALGLDQLRDDDVTLTVDHQEDEKSSRALTVRRIGSFVAASIALSLFVFLVSVAFGAAGRSAEWLFSTAILVSAALISIFISRIE